MIDQEKTPARFDFGRSWAYGSYGPHSHNKVKTSLLLAWGVVSADCPDRGSRAPSMVGVHTALLLVHSIGSPRSGTWLTLCSPPESPSPQWPRLLRRYHRDVRSSILTG